MRNCKVNHAIQATTNYLAVTTLDIGVGSFEDTQ